MRACGLLLYSKRSLLIASQLALIALLQACGGGGSGSDSTANGSAGTSTTLPASTAPLRAHAHQLNVTAGTGGDVVSHPTGISCGTRCSMSFGVGTAVTLLATPAAGYKFQAWTGSCSGTSPSCTVEVNGVKTVGVSFAATTETVSVTSTAGGVVTSAPAGISCGTSCSASFSAGTPVVLTAAPSSGYTFSGGGGACSGTASTCTLTSSAAGLAAATATFAAVPVTAGGNPPGACAQTASSVVFTNAGSPYAFTQYGNYFVQLNNYEGMPGVLTQWMNGPGCWGTSTTQAVEEGNLPASPEVTRGWTPNAGAMQAGSAAGTWTTQSGMGLKVSSITKVHAKWAMTVPTTQNTGDTVSRWDALLDIYFHTAAQGAPNPPASAWPPMVDLQIYQMLMDQPLPGQPANTQGYWSWAASISHPFVKTISGVTYLGQIDGQNFNATGGHTISLFVEPTNYTNSATTTLLWGPNSATHDVGGLIAWLSSANPTDDSGNPIMNHIGMVITTPLIDPSWYLSSINGGFELDFGTANNNQWTTTDFWVAVQNEPDGN